MPALYSAREYQILHYYILNLCYINVSIINISIAYIIYLIFKSENSVMERANIVLPHIISLK